MKLFLQGDQVSSPQQHRPSQVWRMVTFVLIVTLLLAGVGVLSSFETHKAHAATTWTLAPTVSAFTQSVSGVSASQALVRFQPRGWTAGYVIVHYQFANTVQQNVNMTYDSGTGSWLYTINGLSLETVIYYSFTYQQNGLQYDTGSYTYTFGGVVPTPTPPVSVFTQSVSGVSASQALVRFQPRGWTAGYVIVHYQFANTAQQNVNMTYDSGTGSWLYTISGLSLETVIYYSFTYQQNGLRHDTGSYTYTF